MSNVQYSLNVNVQKNLFIEQIFTGNITAFQNTAGMLAVTLQLGTAATAINTASASSVGFAFARNLSTVNTSITLGPPTNVFLGRLNGTAISETVMLKAGEAAWFRLAPGDYGAKASTDDVPLFLKIFED
jgi:hypothetical protein